MSEKTLKEVINGLLLLAVIMLLESFAMIPIIREESMVERDYFTPKDFVAPIPRVEWWNIKKEERKPVLNRWLEEEAEMRNIWQNSSIEFTTLDTEYLGRYFITSYCPAECGGSWMTSSGAICHYSDDPMEPTTCAIDRNYHKYGELLMIDGKVYVTEDTGPGVRGLWVDCFVETMYEVQTWPTGYKSVYSVSYTNHKVDGIERRSTHEYLNNSIHYGSIGDWRYIRNDSRANG